MHYKFLKKYYFIDKFNKENIDKQDKNTSLIYRNYSKIINKKTIVKIRNYCKKKKINFFLSNNLKLALKLNLNGAYIPAFNKNFRHLNYSIKKNFFIIGSAHNIYEIRTKEIQNTSKIFISSVFKKNKNYLGINKFKLICRHTNKKTIALGGISKKNLKTLQMSNCIGFAGISYFR